MKAAFTLGAIVLVLAATSAILNRHANSLNSTSVTNIPLSPAPLPSENVQARHVAPIDRVSSLLKNQEIELTEKSSPERDLELARLARSLSPAECARVGEIVRNSRSSANQRSLGVYILSLAGPAALPELTRIASFPIKNSGLADAQAWTRSKELNLRTNALLAIDAATENSGAKDQLYKILNSSADSTIKKLASVALSGWLDHHPHRLERMADSLTERKRSL